MTQTLETFEFQAEARQLLHLMVHSIYSDKDIFLRELISNASDALDRGRLEALVNHDTGVDVSDLHIEILSDPQKRTLSVRDNGIGMSREDVIALIGTIARSGTGEFLRLLKEKRDETVASELIGQFGVGFYSTFMVADRVTLLTRRAGEQGGTRWESDGEGTYTLEADPDAPQGTTVTVHLKAEDAEDGLHDYTSEWKIREIVKKYSDFIAYPIRMEIERKRYDAEGKALEGSESKVETLNSMKAIWARGKDDVTTEEYHEFYKHVSHDWTDPLRTIPMRGEGTLEFDALLFIPSSAPFDLFMREGRRGIQLYVKRVFIMDRCEELMPEYLRFVKGVVDAQDLSLNVSREILQKDRRIQQMRRRLVMKVLSTLQEMQAADVAATTEGEKGTPAGLSDYRKFWTEFGRVFKEGVYQDADNRTALLDLCLFASTTSGEALTTLKDYAARMNEKQEAIWFLTGESRATLENSPHLEAFKARGQEVLLLDDPIDEFWVNVVGTYQDKPFRSAAAGEVELGSEEEKKQAEETRAAQRKDMAALLAWMGTRLEKEVKEVRLSGRLTTSPACLVGEANDITPHVEKLLRAAGQEVPRVHRVLELNPTHPLITGLQAAYVAHPEDARLPDAAELIYGLAVLAEGGELAEPARFSHLLADTLARSLEG